MSVIPQIVELMSKLRRTNSRSLRKNYADQAKALLAIAEKETSKTDPAARAGLRRARNELIQVLDYEFPEISRPDELKKLGGFDGLDGQSCNLGLFSNTNIIKKCSWITIASVGAVLYLLGRSHRKVVAARKKRARARARARARRRKKRK